MKDGPMLATAMRAIPRTTDFTYEVKYDGFRAFAIIELGSLRIRSRNRADMTWWFPELAEIVSDVRSQHTVIDGEVIVGNGSVESFNELLKRGRTRRRPPAAPPVTFVAFDALEIDGRDLRSSPIEDRRAQLESVVTVSERIVISRVFDDGATLFELALQHGLEGVVGKRRGSSYQHGRSRDWIKVKARGAAERHDWNGGAR